MPAAASERTWPTPDQHRPGRRTRYGRPLDAPVLRGYRVRTLAPGRTLQFDAIRRILKQESRLAVKAAGAMGNAQQPIMVLPNIYFFARAPGPAYLDRSDEDVLRDFAEFLGGPADLSSRRGSAWPCLSIDCPRIFPIVSAPPV